MCIAADLCLSAGISQVAKGAVSTSFWSITTALWVCQQLAMETMAQMAQSKLTPQQILILPSGKHLHDYCTWPSRNFLSFSSQNGGSLTMAHSSISLDRLCWENSIMRQDSMLNPTSVSSYIVYYIVCRYTSIIYVYIYIYLNKGFLSINNTTSSLLLIIGNHHCSFTFFVGCVNVQPSHIQKCEV